MYIYIYISHIYIHYMYLYGFINIHTTHKSRYCHHSTVNPLFRVMSNKPTTFLNKTSQKVPSEAHQASRLTQGAGAADRYGAWSTTKAIRRPGFPKRQPGGTNRGNPGSSFRDFWLELTAPDRADNLLSILWWRCKHLKKRIHHSVGQIW